MNHWNFSHRAFQVDLARQIERPETVIRELPHYADWGFNTAFLYLEGAFRYPSDPAFTRPGYRCVRPHAIPLPANFGGGRLRLEVFPYGPIGISHLRVQQGAQTLPLPFRVVEKSGRVHNPSALFEAGHDGCEIGDRDAEAQTHDLNRRAIRHFVELAFDND